MKFSFKILLAAALLIGTGNTFAKAAKATHFYKNDTENRNVSGFKGVNLSGSYNYFITQGNTESLRIEAPKDVIKNIVTEVKNGVLYVYTKNHIRWNMFKNEKIAVYITAKEINSISLSGSGDVDFKGGIKAENLSISLTGSGDMDGKITATAVETSVTGSGDIALSGRTQNLKARVTGSGDLSTRGLQSTNVYVEVTGSGDADVYASGSLNAHVSGSGDINYSGNPKSISKSKSGSGSIHKD